MMRGWIGSVLAFTDIARACGKVNSKTVGICVYLSFDRGLELHWGVESNASDSQVQKRRGVPSAVSRMPHWLRNPWCWTPP